MAVTEPNASETVNSGELGHVAHTRRLAKLANQAKAEINGRLSDDALSARIDEAVVAGTQVFSPELTTAAYGAVGDGVTDDTDALLAAIEAAAGGGRVTSAAGKVYKINQTIDVTRLAEYDIQEIDFHNAVVVWAGPSGEPMFRFDGAGHASNRWRAPIVKNIRLNGGGTASCGFEWIDAQLTEFHNIQAWGFSGHELFHLKNYATHSEQQRFDRINIRDAAGIAIYYGAADTGGTGTDSFKGAKWTNVYAGNVTTWFTVHDGASVYDSHWDLSGNADAGDVLFRLGALGLGPYTTVRHTVESSGAAYVFDLQSLTRKDTFRLPRVETPNRRDWGNVLLVTNADPARATKFHVPATSGVALQAFPLQGATPGDMWQLPGIGHTAIFTPAGWKPVWPADEAQNACIILTQATLWHDAAQYSHSWSGATAWPNIGSAGGSGATATGSPTRTTDTAKNSLVRFDGVDDSQGAAVSYSPSASDNFSVMLVAAFPNHAFAQNYSLFGTITNPGGTTQAGFCISTDTSGNVKFAVNGGSARVDAVCGNPDDASQHDYVGVRSVIGATITGYMDGVTSGAVAAAAVALPSSMSLRFARRQTGSNEYVAEDVYAALYWPFALTAAQVAILHQWAVGRRA